MKLAFCIFLCIVQFLTLILTVKKGLGCGKWFLSMNSYYFLHWTGRVILQISAWNAYLLGFIEISLSYQVKSGIQAMIWAQGAGVCFLPSDWLNRQPLVSQGSLPEAKISFTFQYHKSFKMAMIKTFLGE